MSVGHRRPPVGLTHRRFTGRGACVAATLPATSIPRGPPTPAPQPQPFPPVAQSAPTTQPGGWPHAPVAVPPQPVEARDRTARTLGTIGIVLGGLALLAQLGMVLIPMLFMGAVFGLDDEMMMEDGGFPPTADRVRGTVAVDGGFVRGEVLTRSVVEAVEAGDGWIRRPDALECPSVPKAEIDVSVLCTATGKYPFYAVVRFTGTGGAYEAYTVSDLQGEEW